ncbi:MAG: hypothetical protein ACRD0U_09530 [Acidimicrobiales bacterium]
MTAGRPIDGHGIRVEIPVGWDGRLRKAAAIEATSSSRPVVHTASFALPEERGDFGGGAVELMTARDVFVALVEYEPASASTALFAAEGMPRNLAAEGFQPNALQRVIAGQLGGQWFFHERGRAFCLYVVIGSRGYLGTAIGEVNRLLATVTIE